MARNTLASVLPQRFPVMTHASSPLPLLAEEALPLPPQEGTVTIPIEAAEPPRGLFTRINEDILKKIEYRGYLKSEIAYRYVTPAAFSKILNILQLEPSYSLNS